MPRYTSMFNAMKTGVAANITGYGDFTHNTTASEVANQGVMGQSQFIPNLNHLRGIKANMGGRGRAGGPEMVITPGPAPIA